MTKPLRLHSDRLFPDEARTRDIARALHAGVKDLPIISPHGHTDPVWFARNEAFTDPASLLIVPDHYVFRMLYSQGVSLEALGVPTVDGSTTESDPRKIWRIFASHYHLFRGTPSRIWLDWVFAEVFGMDVRFEPKTADLYYDTIDAALKTPEFRPRALFDRFGIELIATTESPLDPLEHHAAIRASDWNGRVVTAYRPDPVVDPDTPGFAPMSAASVRPQTRMSAAMPAISPRTASTAPASARQVRPRPITAILRQLRQTSRAPKPKRSTPASWRSRPPRTPNCSARRC